MRKNHPVIDQEILVELLEFMGSELTQLYDEFRQDTIEIMDALEQEIGKRDWQKIAELSHTIKSAGANLGLVRLADACATLEMSARNKQEQMLNSHYQDVVDEFLSFINFDLPVAC